MRVSVTLSLFAALGGVFAVPGRRYTNTASDITIQRDVVIIGGGSSGTFAAVKLRRMGKKVALVERHGQLGGHTSTYHVPNSNITIDYGVQGYGDEDVIRNHFASFDIPTHIMPLSETGFGISNYLDFRNGRIVRDFTFNQNLSGYRQQSERYPYLYYTTRLPDPVPRDFLLPFGEFLRKYRLEDTYYNMFYNLQGLGDLMSQPTLYILRYFNREYLNILDPSNDGALVTSRRYNQELYHKSRDLLGRDVFLKSQVIGTRRDSSGVRVTIQTPEGRRVIQAKKLLISIPPLERNMEVFGLDRNERGIFSKFKATGWYVGLVKADGLPENFAYQNTRPDTRWNVPQLPALYQMSPTFVPGIYLVRYGSEGNMADALVKSDILRTFDRVRFAVIGKTSNSLKKAELLSFASHYPFNLHVSAKEIDTGFYNKLDDLQGRKSTWYTGAAIISHATGALWNFTDHLVDRMYE